MHNKTKIVATLGPASAKRGELRLMMLAGASVFRINGAHGSPEENKKTIDLVREVSHSTGIPAAVLVDLPGPKYRIGRLANEPMSLRSGDRIELLCSSKVQRGNAIPVPHNIAKNIRPGNKIFINDGMVELSVVKVEGRIIFARVKTGGEIRSNKGINLPGTKLTTAALTKKDREILDFAIRNDADFVGLSFVRTRSNILALRRMLKRRAPHIGIIAKIEKPEALADLEGIVDAADAVMVARGDLGIEMPFDRVPLLQRRILRACLQAGKPAITATQMMESMVRESRPTRAEATDVAGAVWEGTDAVMLSEETSIGK
nr:pyruvate kinase [bacterium]